MSEHNAVGGNYGAPSTSPRPLPFRALVARLQSEHTALSGRIADLQRERDDAVRFQSECETRLLARAEAAEAEVTRLREALERADDLGRGARNGTRKDRRSWA
jgi:hypothetical protein